MSTLDPRRTVWFDPFVRAAYQEHHEAGESFWKRARYPGQPGWRRLAALGAAFAIAIALFCTTMLTNGRSSHAGVSSPTPLAVGFFPDMPCLSSPACP